MIAAGRTRSMYVFGWFIKSQCVTVTPIWVILGCINVFV
jgi:hypothetical protein